jgi:hypothetical protein
MRMIHGGLRLCLSLWTLASPLCFAGFRAGFITELPSLFVSWTILASFLASLALWLCEIALPSLLGLHHLTCPNGGTANVASQPWRGRGMR